MSATTTGTNGLRCSRIVWCVLLVLIALTLVGCDDSGAGRFNGATRQLHQMLNTTGNDDSDVLAACSAVEDAFASADTTKIKKEQADAMKRIADEARFWRLHLTTMKINALSTALGGGDRRDAASDIEIGRLMFPGFRSSVRSYVEKYN